MQGRIILTVFVCCLALCEGFLFAKKCPIKKYGSSKFIIGNTLFVHKGFVKKVDAIEKVAKSCQVHVFVRGSYIKLSKPDAYVSPDQADLAIGHGFQFDLRTSGNAMLCNSLCLSRNPTSLPDVKCFLDGVQKSGIKWSRSNSGILSDGTYASNIGAYPDLKKTVQTRCQNQKFKRELLEEILEMYEKRAEEDKEDDSAGDTD